MLQAAHITWPGTSMRQPQTAHARGLIRSARRARRLTVIVVYILYRGLAEASPYHLHVETTPKGIFHKLHRPLVVGAALYRPCLCLEQWRQHLGIVVIADNGKGLGLYVGRYTLLPHGLGYLATAPFVELQLVTHEEGGKAAVVDITVINKTAQHTLAGIGRQSSFLHLLHHLATAMLGLRTFCGQQGEGFLFTYLSHNLIAFTKR